MTVRGDAFPRVAGARGLDDRVAGGGAQVVGRGEPAGERGGELWHRVVGDLEREPGVRLGRDGLGERARDLAEPGVVGDDRQGAAGGGLGGDHAEGLGERARDRHRLGRGQQVGELGVVEPPGPGHAVAQALGRLAVGVVGAREEGVQLRQLAAVLGAGLGGGLEVAGGELVREPLQPGPERPEADDQQPRPRLARRARAGTPPAAARRPWTRSACRRTRSAGRRARRCRGRRRPRRRRGRTRRVARRRAPRRRRRREARAAWRRRAATAASGDAGRGRRGGVPAGGGAGEAAGPRAPAPARGAPVASAARRPQRRSDVGSSAARRSLSASRPRCAASASRGAKRATSTPGGPRRVRAGSDGSSISAHRLSAVWREPTSTPRAPASPSTAKGLKRGYGLTVYSSALPWILTA